MTSTIKPPKWILLYVFFTGAVVMMLEMAAFRLLTPVFGSSIIVWGNIIGVVMIALAIGYFFGGKLADKYPRKKTLFSLGLAAALYSSLIPIALTPLLRSVSLTGLIVDAVTIKLIIVSFLAAVVVFAPALVILGMVSPVAIKLATSQLQTIGQTAGRVYSASTTGSIIGTFLASFILLPFVGTQETIFISAGVLMVISIIGFLPRPGAAVIFVVPLAGYSIWLGQEDPQHFYETESLYSSIRIEQGTQSYSLKMNEGLGIHSMYNPSDFWTGSYWDHMGVLAVMLGAQDITIVGVAGGSIPRVIKHLDPNVNITGVEIDPELTKISRQFFGSSLHNVNVIHMDGRTYVENHPDEADLLIMDAYGRDAYIPFHLATKEFFQAALDHVKQGGVVAFNIAAITPESNLYKAIQATAQEVFPNLYFLTVEGTGNIVLVGSQSSIDWNNTIPFEEGRAAEKAQAILSSVAEIQPVETRVLTDNRSPIEFLTDTIIFSIL